MLILQNNNPAGTRTQIISVSKTGAIPLGDGIISQFPVAHLFCRFSDGHINGLQIRSLLLCPVKLHSYNNRCGWIRTTESSVPETDEDNQTPPRTVMLFTCQTKNPSNPGLPGLFCVLYRRSLR